MESMNFIFSVDKMSKKSIIQVDGKRSAQFEQTLLVTDSGCEVLTARRPSGRPWFMDQLADVYGEQI